MIHLEWVYGDALQEGDEIWIGLIRTPAVNGTREKDGRRYNLTVLTPPQWRTLGQEVYPVDDLGWRWFELDGDNDEYAEINVASEYYRRIR